MSDRCNVRAVTPSPKSAILDLLQSTRGRSMPVRALVEAGALLGLAENGVRVALARLVARGLVERDGPGRYRLAPSAQPISKRVGGWTSADQRAVRWDGAWLGVLTQGRANGERAARRSDSRALAFLGFARLTPGLWIRPDNLRGGVAAAREALHELGLDPHVSVLRLTDLDAAKLERLTPAAAMIETFLIGGRAIRQIALDPCLPEAIAPEKERRALVAAMREYDRAGRACWRDFMRTHDAPHRAAPANLAGLSGEARAAALGSHS
jgi:phenylacetic acid degradation operon negative regulatory protein